MYACNMYVSFAGGSSSLLAAFRPDLVQLRSFWQVVSAFFTPAFGTTAGTTGGSESVDGNATHRI